MNRAVGGLILFVCGIAMGYLLRKPESDPHPFQASGGVSATRSEVFKSSTSPAAARLNSGDAFRQDGNPEGEKNGKPIWHSKPDGISLMGAFDDDGLINMDILNLFGISETKKQELEKCFQLYLSKLREVEKSHLQLKNDGSNQFFEIEPFKKEREAMLTEFQASMEHLVERNVAETIIGIGLKNDDRNRYFTSGIETMRLYVENQKEGSGASLFVVETIRPDGRTSGAKRSSISESMSKMISNRFGHIFKQN